MTVEAALLSYGPLGLFTLYLIYENRRVNAREEAREERLSAIVETNTRALSSVAETIRLCRRA